MLLVGFSRFACVSDAHVTPGVGSQVFLADAQSYHPHCVAHVHFYAGMYGEFAVCFFAVDQHVHAQVTGIDVSVYLPGHKRNQIQGLHTGFLILTSPPP